MQILSREALILVLSRRARSRSAQKRVDERFAANKCLMVVKVNGVECDCQNSTVDPVTERSVNSAGNRVSTRGVCVSCFNAFMYHKRGLTPEKAAAFESDVVSNGWILAQQETRSMKTKFAFQRLTG